MKIEWLEDEYGCNIDLTPETPAEVAALLRMTKNAKAVKPDISFYFEGDKISTSIWLKKLPPKIQKKTIKNP